MRRIAAIFLLAFATAGQWITLEDGTRVCRLTRDLRLDMMVLEPDFCTDWQPGFVPANQFGQAFPLGQGYMRRDPDSPGYQFHVEDKWVP